MSHLPVARKRQTLVASAMVLTNRKIKRLPDNQGWQDEAWRLYDITGELRYAFRYESNAVSRCSIIAARRNPNVNGDPVPLPDDHPAQQLVHQFLGGPDSQTDALKRLDVLLGVVGAGYIVAYDNPETDTAEWHVLSSDELKFDNVTEKWTFKLDTDDTVELEKDTPLVIRIWTSHPRYWFQADSPVRGLLPVLRELEGLTKHVSATIDSRLAGAGVLFLPQEMTFVTNRTDLEDGDDPFVMELMETMMIPVQDRDTAAALVPLVVKAPGELLANIKHLTFSTDFDERTVELRNEAIRRIALGLDIPPEILLGMADLNHWTAWQIEESAVKLHIEPKLKTIVAGVTKGYLRPALQALRDDGEFPEDEHGDIDDYMVWYDTTPLKLRPNRSQDAEALHDDILITDEARRRSAGFSEDDAVEIGSKEWVVMVLRHALVNQPQFAESIIPAIGAVLENETLMNMDLRPDNGGSNDQNNAGGDADADGPPGGSEEEPADDVAAAAQVVSSLTRRR